MSRIGAAAEVCLTTDAGEEVRGSLEDVSVVGLRMRTTRDLASGTYCRALLRHGSEEIEARGVVVRAFDGLLALRFRELPFESYERLRSLLMKHAHDSVAVDDELADRLGYLTDEQPGEA